MTSSFEKPQFAHKTLFDPRLHTWDEIAQAMCQAELVHETIVVLSFLPIIASIWFGDFLVFLITSVLAACYDLLFVFMQRSNRPRVLKIVKRTGATIFSAVNVNRYICCRCGYTEEWIDREDLEKIKGSKKAKPV